MEELFKNIEGIGLAIKHIDELIVSPVEGGIKVSSPYTRIKYIDFSFKFPVNEEEMMLVKDYYIYGCEEHITILRKRVNDYFESLINGEIIDVEPDIPELWDMFDCSKRWIEKWEN